MTRRQTHSTTAPDPIRDAGGAVRLGQRTFSEPDWQYVKARYGLTPREFDAVRHLFDTAHRPHIAASLGISVHTVDTHLRRAFGKVGVEDRGDLILALVNQVEEQRASPPSHRGSG